MSDSKRREFRELSAEVSDNWSESDWATYHATAEAYERMGNDPEYIAESQRRRQLITERKRGGEPA